MNTSLFKQFTLLFLYTPNYHKCYIGSKNTKFIFTNKKFIEIKCERDIAHTPSYIFAYFYTFIICHILIFYIHSLASASPLSAIERGRKARILFAQGSNIPHLVSAVHVFKVKTFVINIDLLKYLCNTNIDRARVLGNAVFGSPLLRDLCLFLREMATYKELLLSLNFSLHV